MYNYPEINARRAIAGGWTNIIAVAGTHATLLGEPPDGGQNSRGQALVPDYCGDWRHAGQALGAYTGSSVWTDRDGAYAKLQDGEKTVAFRELFATHASAEAAMRMAIIRAETMLLEARTPREIRREDAVRGRIARGEELGP